MPDDPNDPDLVAALSDALETLRAMRLSSRPLRYDAEGLAAVTEAADGVLAQPSPTPRVAAAWADPVTRTLRVTVEMDAAQAVRGDGRAVLGDGA